MAPPDGVVPSFFAFCSKYFGFTRVIMSMRYVFSLCLLLLFPALIHAQSRTWLSKDGSKTFEAEYLSHNQFTVTVKRSDGKVITVSRSELHPGHEKNLIGKPQAITPGNTVNEPVMDDNAVLDTLKLGDTHKEVSQKLKASRMLELTVDEMYLGRFGLNGSYRTKQTIGGLKCLLYFDWDNDSCLKEVNLQTQPQSADRYNGKLQETWRELVKLMTTLHGKPLQNADFPASSSLQNDMSLSTHLWRLSGGGSALLGTSKSAEGYMVSVRFTTDAIEPVRTSQ
jgi:hypothetical protein